MDPAHEGPRHPPPPRRRNAHAHRRVGESAAALRQPREGAARRLQAGLAQAPHGQNTRGGRGRTREVARGGGDGPRRRR